MTPHNPTNGGDCPACQTQRRDRKGAIPHYAVKMGSKGSHWRPSSKEIRDACRQDPTVPRNVLVEIARKKQERSMLTEICIFKGL